MAGVDGGFGGECCADARTRGQRVPRRGPILGRVCLVTISLMLMLASSCAAGAAGVGMPKAAAGTTRPIEMKVRLQHGHPVGHALRSEAQRARAAIVGGNRIAITQAPWQALVLAVLSEDEGILCGGAILNETEVLTAGHCVYDPYTSARIPADEIAVFAGTADLEVKEPGQELSLADAVRVHPYFTYNPTATQAIPDDVAVVQLKTGLVFGPDVNAISLTPSGSLIKEGSQVELTGFGEENPVLKELNGSLYSIGMAVDYSRECGGEADALFVCANAPTGSACFGDSGSGLTLPGSPATLVGVTDTLEVIEGKPCLPGAIDGFANVAAPEIRDFVVEDNPSPPRAPRGGGASLHGTPRVGETLTCDPGTWSGDPTFTYTFIGSVGDRILREGSSATYELGEGDLGSSILCEVSASNAGGTGSGRTQTLSPVQRSVAEEERTIYKSPEAPWAKEGAEEEARRHAQERLAQKKHEEEAAAAATKKHQEEEEAIAKKHQEERAAEAAVLGVKEVSPDATIASSSVIVGPSGSFVVKIKCPSGEASCAGTVTLRTLHAVSAGTSAAAHDAKSKAAIVTLASGSFAVAGGRSKAVTLHLSATGKKLLAHVHLLSARATITAHNPAGGKHTGETIVTLHASTRKARAG
ncbi:MAG TPA: serine protease [Solirubrobacteraceae bacterium]|nr:serine protease [Solirubrobacteraceae bacterium]